MYIIIKPSVHKQGNMYRLTTTWEWANFASGLRSEYNYTQYLTEAEAQVKMDECNATLEG